MNCPQKLAVFALVTKTIYLLGFAMLAMEVAETVLMKGSCVGQTLHGCIKEAGVSVVGHGISDTMVMLIRVFKHQLVR